ncbi:uncharacterized protein LOC143187553 [Calliopsis andreniformis]|uniref:uncharacterized protein LOC143187553 n=1 Tax=Calliopsis andreniformis TaxID=337506 RepID=UPI003FCCCEEC
MQHICDFENTTHRCSERSLKQQVLIIFNNYFKTRFTQAARSFTWIIRGSYFCLAKLMDFLYTHYTVQEQNKIKIKNNDFAFEASFVGEVTVEQLIGNFTTLDKAIGQLKILTTKKKGLICLPLYKQSAHFTHPHITIFSSANIETSCKGIGKSNNALCNFTVERVNASTLRLIFLSKSTVELRANYKNYVKRAFTDAGVGNYRGELWNLFRTRFPSTQKYLATVTGLWMDTARRRRTSQRAAFTRAFNALNEALDAQSDDRRILVALEMLEEKANDLDVTTKNILDSLFDPPARTKEEIQHEYDNADEYRRKFLQAKHAVSDYMSTRGNEAAQRNIPVVQSEVRKTYKLPKIEMIKFGGDLRDWLQFWSLFKKIHEDSDIAKEDKFQYLVQAMVPDSRAAELVKSYPPTGENYDKVIAGLKNRFGREDLQIEVYVRELLQLVLQNAITHAKEVQLSSLYDKIESHLRALESLGVTIDKCAAMLFPLVESSLPEELLRAWQRSSAAYDTAPQNEENVTRSKDRLTQLIKFLDNEVQNELRISMAVQGFRLKVNNDTDSEKPKKHKTRADSKDIPSAMGLLTMKSKNNSCLLCDLSDHESSNCGKARKLTLSEREDCVKKKRACFNCLKTGHGFKTCRVNVKCAWCSRRHLVIMCPEVLKREKEPKNNETVNNECSLVSFCSDPEVFMQTLRVKLRKGDVETIVRAVIDTGSQKSYITEDAATLVEYEPTAERLMTHSLFGGQKSGTVNHKEYVVHLKSLDNSYACNFAALGQRVICGEIPSIKNGTWLEELKKLNIEIMDLNSECGLVAVETLLGWTLMGAVPEIGKREDATLMAISMFVKTNDVEDLWALDVLGIKDPIEAKTQKQREEGVKENFLKTVKKNGKGRYEVQLPWLENHPGLSDNKDIAVRRLQSTVKKLKTEGLYADYHSIFEGWLAEGIIERVPEEEKDRWGHYLPHRHVIKENSTTRIRPVFDASAKERQFPSLNECLEKGPNLTELVSSVLLRFREGEIGVIADIKRAFLQISIDARDRDFLRFLWYDDQQNIVILRHCRVVFGVSSSPFILGAVIAMHFNGLAESFSNSNARFSKHNILKLLKGFYVDNCVTSVDYGDQLNKFICEAKAAMELASFDLRGWEYSGDNSRESQTAVLALDQFRKEKITKRYILSLSHRVFDPLGLICPIALYPRILLQETWAHKLSWDEDVTVGIKSRFLNWVNDLENLNKVEVPRCMLGKIQDSDNASLHTFCDASKLAYAVVVYIRIESGSDIKVNFVQSKSRVAPTGKNNVDARHSIPRLELLAATIGVRLTTAIVESLSFKKIKIYYWTDSATALAWFHRDRNWGTFVWNRVKEIRKLSDPKQWGHVPGRVNPADLPSRGCAIDQLIIFRWWEGPNWLHMASENWPNSESNYDEEEINKELKKTKAENIALMALEKVISWYIEISSSYTKTVRIVAWMKRFCFNCRTGLEFRKKQDLSLEEIKDTEVLLIKTIQTECFTGENDVRIKHFLPFKDESNIIRLNTKIVLREDTYNFRCPIILPNCNKLVKLIIKEKHETLKHSGVEITMSALREKFWILGGRKAIRSDIKQCVSCCRYDAKPLDSVSAPLPLNRVRDAAIFEIIGVDCAGPIYLKGGQKAWVYLFTCAVFRAVHLELITSLSTASFLMALRRHIARRGRPTIIYSDNGTNFVGLNNIFKRIDFEKLARTVKVEQIEWKFNPPTAAWWGGFWERLIGILKRLLRRTLKRSCLNYEEMLTVLLDCEAVINSRPLTFMSEGKQEVVPLTPAMFLQEIKEIGVLDLDQIERCQLDKRYLYRQKVKDDLRQRFRNEYLGALIHRKSRLKDVNVNDVSVGDIVLIENKNAKRLEWPLARVNEVIAGKDNRIRVVRLTTASGELVRPIQRIYPLELKRTVDSDIDKVIVKNYKASAKACEDECVVTRSGRQVRKPERLSYN